MGRTSWSRLLATAVVSTAVSFTLLRLSETRGGTVLPVPLLSCVVVLLIAAVVASLGWSVRQYTRGKRPGMDVLVAARTVVLAKASAYTGALLTGWYAGHALLALGDLQIEARRDLAVSGAVAVVCTLLLTVVGLVVERWCEVPGDDEDERGPGGSTAQGTTA